MSGKVNSTGAVSGVIGTTVAPAIGTGTDGYVFTATGAGVNPAWEAAAAGGFDDRFFAYQSYEGGMSDPAGALIAFNTIAFENGDLDFDTSTNTLTIGATGYYYLSTAVMCKGDGAMWIKMIKNGSTNIAFNYYSGPDSEEWQTPRAAGIFSISATDTVICYLDTAGSNIWHGGFDKATFFGWRVS